MNLLLSETQKREELNHGLILSVMFQDFTEQAIQIVTLAREEARKLQHTAVGPEHVFLALLDERSGVAAQALKEAGISLNVARTAVDHLSTRTKGKTTGAVPLTVETTAFLEHSLAHAQNLADTQVGPEHMLLSMIQQNDASIRNLFINLNVSADVLTLRTHYLTLEHLTPASSVRQGIVDWAKNTSKEHPYTEQAQMVLTMAQGRARLAGSTFAGTEQLLLGIVSGDSPAAKQLLWLKGINVTLVQEQIREITGPPKTPDAIVTEVAFTPMARRVLSQAQFEAARQKQFTGIIHLLFGLLNDERSMATLILRNLNVRPAVLKAELLEYTHRVKSDTAHAT